MKTATLPSLRVEPELRQAAESVLKEGETLSAFVESAVRQTIKRRELQKEFLARGLQALKEVEGGAPTYSAEEVMAELEEIVVRAKAKA